MAKYGFISTIYNEEANLPLLLQSLLPQLNLLSSVVIVDAGSKDGSVEILKKYKESFTSINKKLIFKIIVKKGNRSRGRNIAIKNSPADVILSTDSGCVLDKNWVKRMIDGFNKKEIDVVSGFYLPIANSLFEKCLSTYTCVMRDKLNSDFLPSSRSIGFKKIVWEKIGGYPEELDTCEDLVFAKRLRENGYTFKMQKNAIVYWQQQKNIFRAFKQFYSYSKGDGQASYIRKGTPFLFLRYSVGVALFVIALRSNSIILMGLVLILLTLYFVWAILKNFHYVNHESAIFYLPLLQVVSDVAIILGMPIGRMDMLFKKGK